FAGGHISSDKIDIISRTIQDNFQINPLLLLPPLLVIVMVILRIPPLPALLGGTVIGALFGVTMQGRTLADIVISAKAGFVSTTGVPMVDELLTRGGLDSMMNTVALIMCALSFGGILERTGILKVLAEALLKRVRRTGSLVATTIFSCLGMNLIASDQYMAIVIPGRMYRSAYIKLGLHPKNLSRCLENSGTLTSPLVPWNSCGAFMGATLGVSPLVYLPFAFLNLSIPVISILYGYTGFSMHKLTPEQVKTLEENPEQAV
ncbi:MAG: Na+/H+ antiporter NhaC, partial [Candidatus Aminicenantes bacterium]|nr:Na+/H+ antiporter NhaC [Candidatus Aminicenantes bacterium]